ncbi:MAG: transposase [Planctomycetia bacterium]|nr:transposase [Planctomycetia bacterium]
MTKQQVRLKQQMSRVRAVSVNRAFSGVTKITETQTKEIEREIAELIREDDDFSRKDKLIQSIPGVGPKTSHAMLAIMPEPGMFTSTQVGSIAGVAPRSRDFGK